MPHLVREYGRYAGDAVGHWRRACGSDGARLRLHIARRGAGPKDIHNHRQGERRVAYHIMSVTSEVLV